MKNPDVFWGPPPRRPRADRAAVQIWRIPLEPPAPVVDRLSRLLCPDERHRAARLRMELHRGRFIVGRGALRTILGGYLGVEPDRLVFRSGEHGKPGLAGAESESPLQFNLTHSAGLALLAVTSGRRVGVDLEQVRPMDDAERIITRFFTARECSAFLKLPGDQRTEAFFRGWTRKEAYMKATGEGFALPLDRFDVSMAPDEPAGLLGVVGRPGEAERWTLADLAPGSGFLGAVAVEGSGWRLSGFQFDPEQGFSILESEVE